MTEESALSIDFSSFVMSIGTAALVELGEIENPVTHQRGTDRAAAKHNIDVLELLAEKTKGNLTASEEMLLKNLLFEIRMKFIKATERTNPSGQ